MGRVSLIVIDLPPPHILYVFNVFPVKALSFRQGRGLNRIPCIISSGIYFLYLCCYAFGIKLLLQVITYNGLVGNRKVYFGFVL